ncbi:FlgO family outer membrane protein [Geomesophilobacter sediminis]|uniref:FlgO domain-containing protein n=1 Tax=Geomesophilobacter sediminis TaxID=2798584 RepID=A0A8J7M196_9BACT|nr:FlgO family outer membrane protein [Geomesophilobacter sediminis]MBJ6726781.1 hypothetical protein [Geomesophilobacter sediminis]
MKRKSLCSLMLGLACLTLPGCSYFKKNGADRPVAAAEPPVVASSLTPREDAAATTAPPADTPAGHFNSQVINLAEQLEKNLDKKLLGNTYIVTSFANLDKLSETTPFGRLVAENLVHELQVRSWKLFDIRLTKDLIVNDSGEFSLSRDLKKIRESYKVSGIVVGTYSVNRTSIILNARVINLDSGLVVSAGQIHLPMNAFAENLLTGGAGERTIMKIVGDYNAR